MNIGELLITLGVNTSGLQKGQAELEVFVGKAKSKLDEASNSATKHAKSLNEIAYSAQKAGFAMSFYLTTPIVAMGTAALKAASDLEFYQQKVVALAGVAPSVMEQWIPKMEELSRISGKTQKELADGLYFVASAGIRGAEAMQVLEKSAMLSMAGMGEVSVVSRILTSALNSYGTESLSAARAADVLTATVREAHVPTETMITAFSTILPIASEMGISFGEVGGMLAGLTRSGATASMAATQLRQIMVTFLGPSKKASDFVEGLGVSFGMLRNEVAEKGLFKGLQHVRDLMESQGVTAHEVWRNVRALSGEMVLLGKNEKEIGEIIDRVVHSYGSYQTAVEVMAETMKTKMAVAHVEWNNALVALGNSLRGEFLTILNVLTNKLRDLTEWWKSLSESTRETIAWITAITAVIGPLLLAAAGLIRVIAFIGTAFAAINFTAIASGFGAVGAAMALVAPEIYIFIGALALLGLGIASYANEVKEAEKRNKAFEEIVKKTDETLADVSTIQSRIAAIKELNLAQIDTAIDTNEKELKASELLTLQLEEQLKQRELDQLDYFEASTIQFTTFIEGQKAMYVEMYKYYADAYKELTKTPDQKAKEEKDIRSAMTAQIEASKLVKQAKKEELDILKAQRIEKEKEVAYKKSPEGIAEEDRLKKIKSMWDTFNESMKVANGLQTLYKRDSAEIGHQFDASKMRQSAYTTVIEKAIEIYGSASREVKRLREEMEKLMKTGEGGINLFQNKPIEKRFSTWGTPNTEGKNLVDFKQYVPGILDYSITDTALKDPTAGWNTMLGRAKNEKAIADTKKWKEAVKDIAKAYNEVGQAFNGMLSSYVSLINAKQQKAFNFIDAIAKREHKSAEWVTKQKEKIESEYNRKKKAAAIAEAIINTAVAVTSALRAGPIVGPILAVLAAAAGAVQVATIQATPMAKGGIVPSGYPNDSYPARLTSGEMVIPPGKLPEFRSGNMNPITIHLTGKLLAEGNDLVYVMDKQITVNNSY